MSGILHLDTDAVLSLSANLQALSSDAQASLQALNGSLQGLNWTTESRQAFDGAYQETLGGLLQSLSAGQDLWQRMRVYVANWEAVGRGEGAAGAAPAQLGDQVYVPSPINANPVLGVGSNSPSVEPVKPVVPVDLAEIDVKGVLNEQPSLLEWFGNAYDVLEEAVGRFYAKSILANLLEAFGKIKEGGDLITSSNEVAELNQKYRDAMDQYGTRADETLKVRYEYSSAEVSQALTSIPVINWATGIVVNVMKAGGIWDDLIRAWEDLKYN